MESPVVVDKPPEYGNGNERGFPFDEGDAGAWSQLAARHPDIAARLRARPQQTWARKRRPQSQEPEGTQEFPEEFAGFERFPFDDIPPEFRDHFPGWSRRYEPAPPPPPQPAAAAATASAATQTDLHEDPPAPPPDAPKPDVDAERSQRSMSAPPDSNATMSGPPPPGGEHSNVRHIPIFVEGRDEPVINRKEAPEPKAEPKPSYSTPPREHYFPEDPSAFHAPPHFSRSFGTPFGKGFRQGPQPFTQQKAYPQTFGRADSPQRSQSPKPHPEDFVKVPVHHEPPKTQQHQQQQQQQEQPAPPKPQPPPANDPITQILGIQTDVLNLMSEVENFTGSKKDKKYMFLDEMLTRNLIKLDNIETEGKENIRLARKEAIRCIQKCIAVLETKASAGAETPQNGDLEMKETKEAEPAAPSDPAPADPAPSAPAAAPAPAPAPEDTRPETQLNPEKPEKKPSPKKKVVKKRDKSKEPTAAPAPAAQGDQPMDVDAAPSQ